MLVWDAASAAMRLSFRSLGDRKGINVHEENDNAFVCEDNDLPHRPIANRLFTANARTNQTICHSKVHYENVDSLISNADAPHGNRNSSDVYARNAGNRDLGRRRTHSHPQSDWYAKTLVATKARCQPRRGSIQYIPEGGYWYRQGRWK